MARPLLCFVLLLLLVHVVRTLQAAAFDPGMPHRDRLRINSWLWTEQRPRPIFQVSLLFHLGELDELVPCLFAARRSRRPNHRAQAHGGRRRHDEHSKVHVPSRVQEVQRRQL